MLISTLMIPIILTCLDAASEEATGKPGKRVSEMENSVHYRGTLG